MATVVWHGFVSVSSSGSDAELLLPPLTALRLKLAPQKPADQFHSLSLNSSTDDVSPPTLKPTSSDQYATGEGENDAYVPHTLSLKSLEMCTENLGCETGRSDVIIYPSSFMSVVNDDGKSPTTRNSTRQQSVWGRNNNTARGRSSSCCFPPPLTTMRWGGERVVVVRSHRSEQGRLVMDAVKCPYSSRSNFVTHRSHGRLRLSLPLPTTTPIIIHSDDKLEIIRNQDAAQLIKTDTATLENQFPLIQTLDIINIRQKKNHLIIRRQQELEEEESESTLGRFQRLPQKSRCMEAGSEHEHQLLHHRHHRKHFINLPLNWVPTT